ncbi:MAG: glycosyltransferase family 4 protein [Planctomycetota bacterium]
MRVLLINDKLDPNGGSQLLTLNIRDGLRGRGHDVRVLASGAGLSNDDPQPEYRCAGAGGIRQTLQRVTHPGAVRVMRTALREFRPDVVHIRAMLTQLSPAILPLIDRLPVLYHAVMPELTCPKATRLLPSGNPCTFTAGRACREHCLTAPTHAALTVQRMLTRRWWNRIDRVIANSAWLADEITSAGFGPAEVVHNAVPDTGVRAGLAAEPTAALVARLSSEKGVDTALAAWSKVLDQVPEARLRVIGDGPERTRLESQARELGLSGSVDFLGQVSASVLPKTLEGSWLQLVPSRWHEPFGLVAAEALMRGVPVLASAMGGLCEIVRDGVTGRLLPPDEAALWSTAAAELLRDRARCEHWGAAARQDALERFAMPRLLDKLEATYADLLQGTALGPEALGISEQAIKATQP